MLAQNFQTADDLGISDAEHAALVKVLGMLERGDLVHHRGFTTPITGHAFNLDSTLIRHSCGTLACIAGWANVVSEGEAFGRAGDADWFRTLDRPLRDLFMPKMLGLDRMRVTTAQAAIALRNYLTTGEPNWSEALS